MTQSILSQISHTLAQNPIGKFCFICGHPDPQIVVQGAGEQFLCANGHQSPRAYIFDGKAVTTIDGDRLIHETVGALVQRQAGDETQTLLFLRRKFPFQYTIPAGHLEYDQQPEAEMARELAEETGLAVAQAEALWPDDPPLLYDPCRRGADWHRWHLFRVTAVGQPRLSDEGRILGWYTPHELQTFANQDLLTPPVQHFLSCLGIIQTHPAPSPVVA